MKPCEKWTRLNNPQTLEDWGISITESEMRTFPEGRAFLCCLKRIERRERQKDMVLMSMVDNMKNTVDEIILKTILGQ